MRSPRRPRAPSTASASTTAAPYPDPASRFQPEGRTVRRGSSIPAAFRWTDAGWAGAPLRGQVIYEMHVGTFTPEGTWEAAARELADLADLGITVLEVMPVAEFPGRFGWGYDGVNLFAPTHLYGEPDDLRRFVDEAHRPRPRRHPRRRLQPLRPRRQLPRASSPRTTSPTGTRPTGARPSTSTARARARCASSSSPTPRYWIDEFHLDGLRLDATQSIFDDSDEHILAAIGREVRGRGAGTRDDHRRRERAAADAPRPARRSAAATGSTRCGTTTSTTRAMVALTGQARGLLHRLPGLAAGVHLGGQVGLPLPGAALQVAAEAAAARRRSICRPRPSSPSSRTTIRSPTPPAASACTR